MLTQPCQVKHHETVSVSTISTCLVNTFRDGNSTTALDSLFQCPITLTVKKYFLTSNLSIPLCNLRLYPLVLSLVTWENYSCLFLKNHLEFIIKNPFCEFQSIQKWVVLATPNRSKNTIILSKKSSEVLFHISILCCKEIHFIYQNRIWSNLDTL